MSTPTKYSYTISTDFNSGKVSGEGLKKEIQNSDITTELYYVETIGDICNILFAEELSPGDLTLLDGGSSPPTSTSIIGKHFPLKYTRIVEIDKKTDLIISNGFTYSSKQFSLSIQAQSKMTAAYQLKDNPALVYPIEWNTIDDSDSYSIIDSSDLNSFYLTAIGTIRAILDSGTNLKKQIREATTVSEVNAIVDNR